MNRDVIEKLLKINKDFYIQTGRSFSRTRQYGWPGWKILLNYLNSNNFKCQRVSDLACGNGRFFRSFIKYYPESEYLGIDDNEILLNNANIENQNSKAKFINMDIIKNIDEIPSHNDLIVLFGFMHHIPSNDLRIKLLSRIGSKVKKDGFICFSIWDFLGKKYEKRSDEDILLMELGINKRDLEEGDHILDWRAGDRSYRYAHYYTEDELSIILKGSGLNIVHKYISDGRDSRSNRYYILKKG